MRYRIPLICIRLKLGIEDRSLRLKARGDKGEQKK